MKKNDSQTSSSTTFGSLFLSNNQARMIVVPDYQRAYSWVHKQVELFIKDLCQYKGNPSGYYFGHFIAEANDDDWNIVDGQQRVTTFVLFLAVAQVYSTSENVAFALIDKFFTASYDRDAYSRILENIQSFLESHEDDTKQTVPSDSEICNQLKLNVETFTGSQRKMALAILDFARAFSEKGPLDTDAVDAYIDVVMRAHCSLHLTYDKSVAVNIFEMHNTRGVPLTTLEVIKAMLMKYVYDHGGKDSQEKVEQIQQEFGKIYQMEERMATKSFRGEMTMDQLLRLHLRVVDDGSKITAKSFQSPPMNATSEELIEYVQERLHFDADTDPGEERKSSVNYALNLAKEIKRSIQIISTTLPQWDDTEEATRLVGDVMILDRDLSCQFFLLICRSDPKRGNGLEGRIDTESLKLWERLLFTRDFHEQYHNLKGTRDNFPELFWEYLAVADDSNSVKEMLQRYVMDGFRTDRTQGLPEIVRNYLEENEVNVLSNAFYWWKPKMIYALYKYETSIGANIREVMKGMISVEHILPQQWEWDWLNEWPKSGELDASEKERLTKSVGEYINGIGNLLLVTPRENTSQGNKRPSKKVYSCQGGSYKEHEDYRDRWESSKEWMKLIKEERGDKIYKFMLKYFLDNPKAVAEAAQ